MFIMGDYKTNYYPIGTSTGFKVNGFNVGATGLTDLYDTNIIFNTITVHGFYYWDGNRQGYAYFNQAGSVSTQGNWPPGAAEYKYETKYFFVSRADGARMYMNGGEINIASDARRKTDIRKIDGIHALHCIRGIQPSYYRTIQTGEACVGFIAQQVEEYIPEAITKHSDFIPNIFCYGSVCKQDNLRYEITLEKTIDCSNIVLPCSIKLSKDDQETTINTNCVVIDIHDNQRVIVEGNLEDVLFTGNRVFVVGTYVPDYRSIAHNVLYNYNIAAVKQIDVECQQMKQELQETNQHMNVMNIEMETMKAEMEIMKAEMQQLKTTMVAMEALLTKKT
jgi:Chaperone of endosialidase